MVDQLLVATIERMIETRAGRRLLLMTGGVQVSGVPVDAREFLEHLSDVSTDVHVDTVGMKFVHLKNVVIRSNDSTRRLAFWRGDLDAVSGWAPVASSASVLEAFEESWNRNEAGYRYLAGR